MPEKIAIQKNVDQYQATVERAVQAYCRAVISVAKGSEYLKTLQGNTERLQGSLVLVGYDLEGGEDEKMILRAALAIEMLHAYVQCMEQGVDIEQALRAQHEAQIILANLETDEENRSDSRHDHAALGNDMRDQVEDGRNGIGRHLHAQ